MRPFVSGSVYPSTLTCGREDNSRVDILFLRNLKALLIDCLAILLLGSRNLFWFLILSCGLFLHSGSFQDFLSPKCLHVSQRCACCRSVFITC